MNRFNTMKGKVTLLIILFVVVVAVAVGGFYLTQPQYVSPKQTQFTSPQYYDGKFHNALETHVMTSSKSQFELFKEFVFAKDIDATPEQAMPSEKTDLFALVEEGSGLVWMGHSSFFMVDGDKTFLIDPVFSQNASPVPMTNIAFSGANVYQAEDIPPIDYLLITHDHWDHLDYPTLAALKEKISHIITPLGVGSYFKQWGFDPNIITEGDWYDAFNFENITIHVLPARHFSGRMLDKNKTLWASFGIQTPHTTFYFGGDSGYGEHFKQIQTVLGAIDYAILECGQYNEDWANIHMFPEQTAQAGADLQAKYVLPSHNSKFKLSHHSWHDPLDRMAQASVNKEYQLLTPMIGQSINLDTPSMHISAWWTASESSSNAMVSDESL